MAFKAMTLAEIKANRRVMDHARLAATTDADIRRHQIEDGEDPDAPLPPFRPAPNVRAIRTRLQMTQEAFARAIGVPVATVRNWEQSRTRMDPAVLSLLRVLDREPDAALRALAGSYELVLDRTYDTHVITAMPIAAKTVGKNLRHSIHRKPVPGRPHSFGRSSPGRGGSPHRRCINRSNASQSARPRRSAK